MEKESVPPYSPISQHRAVMMIDSGREDTDESQPLTMVQESANATPVHDPGPHMTASRAVCLLFIFYYCYIIKITFLF